jgi:hypothetical protein
MPLGDRRYRTRVSRESQSFTRQHDLADPNVFVPSPDAPPFYPDSLLSFLADGDPASVKGNGNGNGAEASAPSSDEIAGDAEED